MALTTRRIVSMCALVVGLVAGSLQPAVALTPEQRSVDAAHVATQPRSADIPGGQVSRSRLGPVPPGAPASGERVFPASSSTQASGSIALDSVTCTSIDAWRNAYTLLGFLAYRYHHWMTWCWDGQRVTSVTEDYDYLTNVDPNFYWRGTVAESSAYYYWNGIWHGRFRSFMEGQVDNCILRYGCIGTSYPWITINAYGDGHYSTSSGGT